MCSRQSRIISVLILLLQYTHGCVVVLQDWVADIEAVNVEGRCLNVVRNQTTASQDAEQWCRSKHGELTRFDHHKLVHKLLKHHRPESEWGFWVSPHDTPTPQSLLYVPRHSNDTRPLYISTDGSDWTTGHRGKTPVQNDSVPINIGFICEFDVMKNRITERQTPEDEMLRRFIMCYGMFILLILTQTGLTVCFVNSRAKNKQKKNEARKDRTPPEGASQDYQSTDRGPEATK